MKVEENRIENYVDTPDVIEVSSKNVSPVIWFQQMVSKLTNVIRQRRHSKLIVLSTVLPQMLSTE